MINMLLHGCSDHQDQLFCLFELKKASLTLRIESRFDKIFSRGINCMSLAVWLGEDRNDVLRLLQVWICCQSYLQQDGNNPFTKQTMVFFIFLSQVKVEALALENYRWSTFSSFQRPQKCIYDFLTNHFITSRFTSEKGR